MSFEDFILPASIKVRQARLVFPATVLIYWGLAVTALTLTRPDLCKTSLLLDLRLEHCLNAIVNNFRVAEERGICYFSCLLKLYEGWSF